MGSKITLNEGDIKDILRQHKLIKEYIDISDIISTNIKKDTPNYKSFIEFLNGNVDLDQIVNDIEGFFKKSSDIEVVKGTLSDDERYKRILQGVGAPVTDENMKFMYAWRQGEGGKAAFNPFNTTKKTSKSKFYNCLRRKEGKCTGGVMNYTSEQEGIQATIDTLNLSYYDCITDGLKNNIGAKKIARSCRKALKTWGTGDLIAKVLDGKRLNPSPIPTSITKVDS
jgi:hypothetical protein